jgi:hypothetical protein
MCDIYRLIKKKTQGDNIQNVASHEGDNIQNVVVLYYQSASQIWRHKRSRHLREVVSLEGDNIVVFYYIAASQIWPHKRSNLIIVPLVRGHILYIVPLVRGHILYVVPLMRGQPSYKATFSLQKGWSFKRRTIEVMHISFT